MTACVLRGSATHLPLPNESVHCIVTSPPYNVGISYTGYNDDKSWNNYLYEIVIPAVHEMYRVLIPGGRAWINVPTNGPAMDNGKRESVAHLWERELRSRSRLWYRDTIIWKQDSHDGGTQWGSWLRPSAPNLRGDYEVIL